MKAHSSTTEPCEWTQLQGQAFSPEDHGDIYYLNRATKGERAQAIEKAIVSLSRDCGVEFMKQKSDQTKIEPDAFATWRG